MLFSKPIAFNYGKYPETLYTVAVKVTYANSTNRQLLQEHGLHCLPFHKVV